MQFIQCLGERNAELGLGTQIQSVQRFRIKPRTVNVLAKQLQVAVSLIDHMNGSEIAECCARLPNGMDELPDAPLRQPGRRQLLAEEANCSATTIADQRACLSGTGNLPPLVGLNARKGLFNRNAVGRHRRTLGRNPDGYNENRGAARNAVKS